jgi:glycine cleavage system H protein
VAGEVVEVNQALEKTPELINQDPYGEGWIFRLRPRDMADLDGLLDAEGYQATSWKTPRRRRGFGGPSPSPAP